MTVVLARPPRRDPLDAGLVVPPLGLAYVAASLREAGYAAEILDALALDWSWERFERELARRRPEVLGLSAMTPTADVAARAARIGRRHARHLVLGGPHPTAVRGAIFDEIPELDAAVVGEGERVAPALLAWWAAGATGDPPAGVLARDAAFREADPERHPERLPRPARDLLPNDRYRYLFATRPGFATMITSRGCPFACTFCDKSVGGSRWRARPAEDVVDEMEELVGRYGAGFINFYDDNFTLRRDRVAAICDEILRRGLDVEWKCEGRVDGVDLPLLKQMRRAGCRVVAYGVESGNPETLASLRKDIDLDETRAAFAATHEAGLRSLAYLILGAPGEDREAVRRSLAFCREIRATYVQFSTLTAFPGTPLYAAASGRASVKNPVDGDARRETLTDLPPEALARLLREAWVGFYLRPAPLARLARDAVASRSLDEALRLGRALGRWAVAS